MPIKLRYWVSILILPILAGCYPKGAEYAEELDLVYTNFYEQFNFSNAKTFAMLLKKIGSPSFLCPLRKPIPRIACRL